jgi:hypothetical protein
MSDFEPCDVEIRIARDGSITPLRVATGGVWAQAGQFGRTWTDDEGDHWLIMPPTQGDVIEIRRGPDGVWMARSTRSYAA